MPPFSRLQLAAALIEYDNDPDDPYAPYRSAEDSAIFSFLKKKSNPRNTIMGYDEMPRQPVDFLKVAVPGEGEESDARNPEPSNHGHTIKWSQDFRRSVELFARPSSEMARLNESMFRGDDLDDEEDPEIEGAPPLNLASWGVEKFLAKEEPRPRSRASSINALGRAASPGPNMRPHHTSNMSNATNTVVPQERGENRRSAGFRARSVGDWGTDRLHDGDVDEQGRMSFSSARPRPSSVADPADLAARNQHPPVTFRNRAGSMSSVQALAFPGSDTPQAEPNPFELAPPSPAHSSRFDPKFLAHQRTTSFASMGTRRMDVNEGVFRDNASIMSGHILQDVPQRHSQFNVIRPKVLVMPQLLQEQEIADEPRRRPVREGYLDSTDARPLPPGAKTERASTYGTLGNRSSMTLAQLTFRNSLMVGGQRDPAFADLESHLKRAAREGEIIEQEVEPEPEPMSTMPMEEETIPHRSAGKLYGRSLIDDLEARKAQIKSKKRVFRGDERPSMMQRPQIKRGDTLISMDDLRRPGLQSEGSQGRLVNMEDEPIPGTNVRARPQMGRVGSGLPQSHSVFGVDQVWEKELVKLKQIEAVEAEEKEKEEAEKRRKEEKAAKKSAKKEKGKHKSIDTLNAFAGANEGTSLLPDGEPIRRTSEAPPLLPAVNPFPMPPKAEDTSSESDSDEEPDRRRTQSRMQRSASRQDWLSDDERPAVPRPRPQQRQASRSLAAGLRVEDSSDDEDVPLTAALAKVKQRQQAEDSEEDKPLAAVLNKAASTFDFGGTVLAGITKPQEKSKRALKAGEDSDDDDKPLGLQHPGPRQTMFARGGNGESDDEQPLGMRFSAAPSQLFMMQQQQQQQQQQQMFMQQQMMAAQMRNTMFNPMFMGGMNGMGGMPGMGMGMGMGFPNSMSMPALNPSMMPVQMPEPGVDPDSAKLGRVDRWRRDVGMADS